MLADSEGYAEDELVVVLDGERAVRAGWGLFRAEMEDRRTLWYQ